MCVRARVLLISTNQSNRYEEHCKYRIMFHIRGFLAYTFCSFNNRTNRKFCFFFLLAQVFNSRVSLRNRSFSFSPLPPRKYRVVELPRIHLRSNVSTNGKLAESLRRGFQILDISSCNARWMYIFNNEIFVFLSSFLSFWIISLSYFFPLCLLERRVELRNYTSSWQLTSFNSSRGISRRSIAKSEGHTHTHLEPVWSGRDARRKARENI